ncbi:MAG: transketolase C-terminal domain-containing protein, partial [Candidatus Komeilibacteria bacterium]|nr:transketolase C-terminal domain-containing protein [Candidatus Komeilibacteria bacterium]
ANVKIAGHHGGVTVGPDGATHQALEDIALMRVLPNMAVVVPADALEAKKATIALGNTKGPAYIRLMRAPSPIFTTPASPFVLGQAETLVKGDDIALVACGPLVCKALQAATILEKKYKIKAEVINSHTIKPLDGRTIMSSAKRTGAVVVIEEHQIHGGLGGAVAEYLAEHYPVPMRFVGMPDSFGESGQPDELLEKYGMTVEKIIASVLELMEIKK